MLAELRYSNTLLSVVLSDINKVLTGTVATSALSAEAQAGGSTLTGDAGTWIAVGNTQAALTDMCVSSSFVYNQNAIVVRQPCTYNNAKSKFFKLALASFAGQGNSAALKKDLTWAVGLGNSVTGTNINNMCPGHKTYNGVAATHTIADNLTGYTSSALVTAISLVVKIAVTPSTTAIALGRNGLTLTNIFTSCDIPEDWMPGAAATDFLPCVYFGIPIGGSKSPIRVAAVSTFTFQGNPYGIIGNATPHDISLSFGRYCGPTLDTLLTDASYKFAGFKSTGTQYALLPISLAYANMACSTSTPILYIGSFEKDYGQISSVTYGCHKLAFGKTGDVTSTANGLFCKFDNFMVKVQ